MQQRASAAHRLAGRPGRVFAPWCWRGCCWRAGCGAADTAGSRIPFQIATGSTAGAFFPVGEAIAGMISHPPGVDRCGTPGVCGPAGLIVTARTSQGAVDNVQEVNDGDAESGLAQGDVVAAAVRGEDQFRRSGKAGHIRVIASLFSEDVHLVVAAKSKIHSVADLRGKRVSLGSDGSGVGFTARAILAAYRVPETSLKIVDADLPTDADLAMMKAGKLDAFFAVGGVPLDPVTPLFSRAARQGWCRSTAPAATGLIKNDAALSSRPAFRRAPIRAKARCRRWRRARSGSCATPCRKRWSMASPGRCSIRPIATAWPPAIRRRARSAWRRRRWICLRRCILARRVFIARWAPC